MNSKLLINLTMMGATAMLLAGCKGGHAGSDGLTATLGNAAWNQSQWISAADAPVVTGTVQDGTRAADGASFKEAVCVDAGRVYDSCCEQHKTICT